MRAVNLLIDLLGDAGEAQDDVRRIIVGELDRMGPGEPLARDMRRRLAAALY